MNIIKRLILLTILLSWPLGCAGPGPRMLPPAGQSLEPAGDGRFHRWYDTDDDQRPDYCECLSAEGRLESLGYDRDQDGQVDEWVTLSEVPADEIRDLVLILDSIPYGMVAEQQLAGRFSFIPPASRIVAPFPVMTDVSLCEFWGLSPVPGIESAYYDGEKLTDALDVYLGAENTPWHGCVDYALRHDAHAFAYLWPKGWLGHELKRIQDLFMESNESTVGYVVSTSGLGAVYGRTGHQIGLVRLDRFCQSLLKETRGRVRITLMSDHGHYMGGPSRRVRLAKTLEYLGYHVGKYLHNNNDVVVPEFGMVTCAAIYTRQPEQVASDVVGIEGIDLAAYLNKEDHVVVMSQAGLAEIVRKKNRYRYIPIYGDVLEMKPTLEQLARAGQVDADGYIDDRVLLKATLSHDRPDAMHRLWRAFHGLIEHPPQVMVTVKDGWFCGSGAMEEFIELIGAHGNLRQDSTYGFMASMAGPLPPAMRMEDARSELAEIGVTFPCP